MMSKGRMEKFASNTKIGERNVGFCRYAAKTGQKKRDLPTFRQREKRRATEAYYTHRQELVPNVTYT
jgi:hypothetical protein